MKALSFLAQLAVAAIAVVVVFLLATRDVRNPSGAANPYRRFEPPAGLEAANCGGAGDFLQAATDNRAGMVALEFAPFRIPERGWEIYAPQIAREIGTACGPGSTGFAKALARWQRARGLTPDGRMSEPAFQALKAAWHRRRPLRGQLDPENCPPPAPGWALAAARADESYRGQAARLRPAALAALRRMREAARRERPEIAADAKALTIVSGYRDPDRDALECLSGGCDNIRRAACSAHRTGLVVDLYVGAAPGYEPTSTQHENRLFQSRTATYRWMTANASRFGFVNYVFEPWHWEWGGDDHAPAETARSAGTVPNGDALRR